MINIEYLDDALVICPTAFKNHILKKVSKKGAFLNNKFMSLEEFLKDYFFDYDFKAVKYFVDKYKMKIDVAKTYLNNLYFIEDKNYDNEKLDPLVNYKKELTEKGLLIENPLFADYLKKWKKILVVGYGRLDKFYRDIFAKLKAEIFEFNYVEKEFEYHSFDTMEKEVHYLYDRIYQLLDNKVDINNIYVMNAGSCYESYFNRYNEYFHFKIEEKNENSFSSLTIVKDFIKILKEKDQSAINDFIARNSNSKHIGTIVSIINKYVQIEEYSDLIIDELNNTKVKNESYTNIVRKVNLLEPFEEDDHVFLVGFNDSCPALSVDTDYITDDIKNLVGLSNTEEKNVIKKENVLNYLSNINNLYLSYCENSLMDNFKPSVLMEKIKLKENNDKAAGFNYSDKLNRYSFSKKLDQFSKYNFKDENLERLYSTYKENNYRKYEHSYKQINRQIDEALNLSYSQVDNYFRCPFKYFIERKLKINDETSQFHMQLGNVFHEVLKEVFENDINDEKKINDLIDSTIEEVISKQQYTESEKFFTRSLKQELLKDIEIIRKQHQKIGFDNYEYEKEVKVQMTENVEFKGIIDKLIHQKIDEERLIVVVDYKTGAEEFKEDKVEAGLSLQLPSYLYLASQIFKDEDKKYAGFYIQHLINTDTKYDGKKTVEEKKIDSMKLDGKSNGDDNLKNIQAFDSDCQNSEFIKALKTKDNKISGKRGMSNVQIENLINLTESKIREAATSILQREFSISPYDYDEACKYCTYSDICYKKNSDYKKVEKKEDDDE